jgi:GTP-binding protein Era
MMLTRAQSSMMESDVILFVTEKRIVFNDEDKNIRHRLPDPAEGKKVILVINKVDKVKEKGLLLPLIEKANEFYPFSDVVPMCALKQKDLDRLLKVIKSYLPEGPMLYPEDELTDKTEEFMIQEIIREKALTETYEEIPHSVAVSVDEMKERTPDGMLDISATIYVEKTSQKSIIIGKAGSKMKRIGELARVDIEKLLDRRVYLTLWVKVYAMWKKDPEALRELGYTD